MPDSQTIIPENTVISAFSGIHYSNIILEYILLMPSQYLCMFCHYDITIFLSFLVIWPVP